jgi:phosphoglycolate phosphatase
LIPYQILLWDFDGTLADTMGLAVRTYNGIAARRGFLPIADPARAREMGLLAFLRDHGIPMRKVPSLLKEYLAATASQMPAIRLVDEMPDTLRALKAVGYRLGILSSNSADNISACFGANGLESVFDFVVGYPRLFGKAAALQRILKRERIRREDILYVGDEIRDLEAAKTVGVDSAAVGWGFQPLVVLAKGCPKFLWTTPREVLAALLPADGRPNR